MAFVTKIKWVVLSVISLSVASIIIHLSLAKLWTINIVPYRAIAAFPDDFSSVVGRQVINNKKLWGSIKSLEALQPSSNARSNYTVPKEHSNGFIYAKVFGGFERIRSSICDLVAISRLLNATLVIPKFQESLRSKGVSSKFKSFSYLYDEEQFIAYLKNDVIIAKTLPGSLMQRRKRNEFPTFRPSSSASPNFYLQEILPKLKKSKVIGLIIANGGALQSVLPPTMAEIQRLRCRVSFQALQFRPELQMLGRRMVNKLRSLGQSFLAYHPGLLRETLAYNGCAELFQDVHTELIQHRRAQMIKDKILNGDLNVDSHLRRDKGLCPLMPEEFDAIADIHLGGENIRINVRVLRLWKVPTFLNPSENGSIEMVLVDDKGGKIHATIKKQLIYMFENKIEEGNTYDISGFAVYPQSGSYRSTLHPYKIVFQLKTKVKLSECSSITAYGLTLTNISDVCAHTHDYEFLVDVIGYMTGLSAEREYIRDGKVTKMVVAELTDHSGKCEIALFGKYAEDLTKKVGKLSSGLPIVVVQFAKVKIFRDKASLQNVMNTTRIFVNPDIAEVESFKNSVAVQGVELDSDVPLLGQPAKPSFEEEFLRMHPRNSVCQLDNLEEGGVSVVCAEIVRVLEGSDWWYPACKCHRSVVADSGSYFCSSCDRHVFQVVPRFRVKVEVSDGGSSAVFVIFDSEMSYVMENSCAYFVSRAKVCSGSSHPNEFDALVGKKMLFSVQKSPTLGLAISSYRVKRICMDAVVIDQFCSANSDPTSPKVVQPVVDLDSDGVANEVDGVPDSQTTEFLEGLIVTPTKSLENSVGEDEMEVPLKRNFAKTFNSASKRQGNKRFKPMKIEKD